MSIKEAAQAVMTKAVQIAPDAWMPGATPDPLIRQKHGLVGTPVSRLDGPQKVSGTAQFAAEFPLERMVYAALKYSTVVATAGHSILHRNLVPFGDLLQPHNVFPWRDV